MKYELPDLKLCPMPAWQKQRAEWVALAEDCLYGHAPEACTIRSECLEKQIIFGGLGIREVIRIHYGPDLAYFFDVIVYAPAKQGRYPAITWNQFSGGKFDCCPYEEAVKRGYIIAWFDREQVAEDEKPGSRDLYNIYPEYDWGAIRGWAWAQSRVADYLLTRDDVDPEKLCCTGFSRGGKAALAAGIFDEHFSICAPICAGAGGCGCFRYLGTEAGFIQDVRQVESLGRIGSVFPHWWTNNFARWFPQPDPTQMGMEQEFPFDSHTLKALIAPRHLFTSDGMQDDWSNPRGTALTWRAAQPAFDLLGGRNVAHFRAGGHAFGETDWLALLDFCDEVYYGCETGRTWDTCPFED